MDARKKELTSTTLGPKFIYACICSTNQLLRTNLLTGEQTCLRGTGYQFNVYCQLSELPGGSLLITGGHLDAVREVVKIDTLRECAVSSQPPMHTARYSHAAVYHSQYLYVLGGYNGRDLSECERYVCAESRWEELPDLPIACRAMSAVVLDNSLYALGGYARKFLDTVQKLNLVSLTWELMQLKLPHAACWFPFFKTESQVYLVIVKSLYSLTPLQVKPIKSLTQAALCCYSSYYSRGTLYISGDSALSSLAVGELA
jgi:hypothetical protein